MSDQMTAAEVDAHNAVDKLTRPWSDVLSPRESGTGKYQPIDHRPLLDMLAEAKSASLGGTGAGRTADSERSIMNLTAFQLFEQVEGRVRGWLAEYSTARYGEDVKSAVRRCYGLVKALHASNQIPEQRYEQILRQFVRWSKQIWELFDPPTVKHLLGTCPACEVSRLRNLEGGEEPTLIAYYWKGIRPEARCQACGELWAGERALLDLGYHLGASVDEDALREMGVL